MMFGESADHPVPCSMLPQKVTLLALRSAIAFPKKEKGRREVNKQREKGDGRAWLSWSGRWKCEYG